MRHSVYGKHLSRDKNERTALFRSLVRSLVIDGSIKTTESKAKAIKPLIDKLITQSKKNSVSSKSVVTSFVNQPQISKKLLEEIAPSLSNRTSGYTNLVKLGRRVGDGAMLVKLSLVAGEKVEKAKTKEDPKPTRKAVKK